MLILRAYKFSYIFPLNITKPHEDSVSFCFTRFYRLSVLLPPTPTPNNPPTYYPEDNNYNVSHNAIPIRSQMPTADPIYEALDAKY